MSVNAMTEEYEHIELFGKPALFTNARVDTHTVPDGWHVYDPVSYTHLTLPTKA